MILIDTHIWIWWANGSSRLPLSYRGAIENSKDGIAISVISCWEFAKKIEKESRKSLDDRTLILSVSVDEWIEAACRLPRLTIIPLTPEIVLESTRLPEDYNLTNTDPADQIIIATARIENLPLMTEDAKIKPYKHVVVWSPPS
jgi:PIN domain nuclease of toxin-antitoxin system